MSNKLKKIPLLPVALCAVLVVVLTYARPMPLGELFPDPPLDWSRCVRIECSYATLTYAEPTTFTIEAGTPAFDELTALVKDRKFHRTFATLLPAGTKTHAAREGEFAWELIFTFDQLKDAGGNTYKNGGLVLNDFYGTLDLYCLSKQVRSCQAESHAAWRAAVYAVLRENAK